LRPESAALEVLRRSSTCAVRLHRLDALLPNLPRRGKKRSQPVTTTELLFRRPVGRPIRKNSLLRLGSGKCQSAEKILP
jgi:hypothetical protein